MKSNIKYVIIKLIVSLLLVISVAVIGIFVAKNMNDRAVDAKNNPEIIYIEPEVPEVAPVIMSPTEIAEKIKDAILKMYRVSEVQEIGYIDSNNILAWLTEVNPTNPEANDGEFTIRFNALAQAGVWTSAQVKQAAMETMRAAIAVDLQNVQGITAITEVWDYRAKKVGAVVVREHISRAELQ